MCMLVSINFHIMIIIHFFAKWLCRFFPMLPLKSTFSNAILRNAHKNKLMETWLMKCWYIIIFFYFTEFESVTGYITYSCYYWLFCCPLDIFTKRNTKINLAFGKSSLTHTMTILFSYCGAIMCLIKSFLWVPPLFMSIALVVSLTSNILRHSGVFNCFAGEPLPPAGFRRGGVTLLLQ